MPSTEQKRERLGRPPLFVAIPATLFIVGAIAWSIYWFVAIGEIERRVAEIRDRQAGQGVTLACGNEGWGGYPFRFTFTCEKAVIDVKDDTPVRLELARVTAVAQAYQPFKVISVLDGPMVVQVNNEEDPALTLDWERSITSVHTDGREPTAIDSQTDMVALKADPSLAEPGMPDALKVDRFEIHLRPTPGATTPGENVDVALSATGAAWGEGEDKSLDASLVARLSGMPGRRDDDPIGAWRANGGAFELTGLRIVQQETVLNAQGTLAPTDRSPVEGKITVALAGPDVTIPGSAGAFGGGAALLGLFMRRTGRTTEIDGKTALEADLELRNGAVYFAGNHLTDLPALKD